DTIDEVLQIQSDGHQKRLEAERQLYEMEAELKKKLLATHMG
ncbi:MAG: toxic anion resistance protein, partial [Clostridia bacterium]|nr:toxic anion resistance protein [Clostridia bacterium]